MNRTPVQATFTLPAGAKKVTNFFEKRAVNVADGVIKESFGPLGVQLYVIE